MDERVNKSISNKTYGATQGQDDVFERIIAASGLGPLDREASGTPAPDPEVSAPRTQRRPAFFWFPESLACMLKPLPGYVWIVFLLLWRKSLLQQSLTVSVTSTTLLGF